MVGGYLEGERHGTWRHYSTDGRLRSEGGFDRSELHGPWTWYRATGGLLRRGGFHHGEKHGQRERWNPAGGLVDSGTWEPGKKSGEWTSYHPGGTVKRGHHPPREAETVGIDDVAHSEAGASAATVRSGRCRRVWRSSGDVLPGMCQAR